TGIYGVYQTQYLNMWLFGDMRADDSWDELVKGTAAAMDLFTINNDDGVIRSTWRNYYNIINRANMLLAKIEPADVAVVKNKDRHIGEAKFLRALAYFDLVRIFGDVPMITTPIGIEDSYQSRRIPVATIYQDVIIADLLDAETKLPPGYTGSNVGRATQGAAKSLLGKVYLTIGEFAKAESKLQEVTTMGYALLQNYNDLFNYTKNEHHSEYIFDIEYEEGMSEGSNFTNNFLPKNPGLTAFYKVTGGGNDANNPPQSLFALFAPGDLRKEVTAANGHYDANGNFVLLVPSANASSTFTKKYMVPVIVSGDSKANWKVLRYADVLLMYAEALNENGKTTEALGYLNMVRARAGLAGYADLNQSDTREMIYLERRLELSFEGHRWFDLLRTGRALSVMAPYGMKPNMTVFPLPLSQVQLINDPAIFPQNEGYD
ncbi:MAG TPA: RagB/SusD family nutrient uptake outer membrane protein, partial [Chryseosolibacter sp.]|nr:RagB/SusD family nutrient uptake outer membrane protein [Chryseosolibacter sp.]